MFIGAGHIQALVNSLKQNMPEKRKVFDRDEIYKPIKRRSIKDKQATPEQLQQIREKVAAENQRMLRNRIIALLISIVILSAGVLFVNSL